MQFLSYFMIQKKCWFMNKNANVSRSQGVSHMICIFFRSPLAKENNAKFHHCRDMYNKFLVEKGLLFATSPFLSSPLKTHPKKGQVNETWAKHNVKFHNREHVKFYLLAKVLLPVDTFTCMRTSFIYYLRVHIVYAKITNAVFAIFTIFLAFIT